MTDRSRRHLRAGYRAGAMSDDLRFAIAAEVQRLSTLGDPVEQARAVGDLFAAIDVELEQVAAVRLEAVREMRAQKLTYAQIAERTGITEARVAQLAREVRAGGRADRTRPSSD